MLFYFMLGAGKRQSPAFRKKAEKHTTRTKTPVISRYRPFVLLRAFHINNNNNNNNTGCLQGGFEIKGASQNVIRLINYINWSTRSDRQR